MKYISPAWVIIGIFTTVFIISFWACYKEFGNYLYLQNFGEMLHTKSIPFVLVQTLGSFILVGLLVGLIVNYINTKL